MKYVKSFKIFESLISFPTSKEEIDNICHRYDITNYIINDDLTIDVNTDVDLAYIQLNKLPLKFNKVTGDFYCYGNQLTSLEGCPNYIGGNFYCNSNKLTSLEGCPNYVGGVFDCYDNKLVNLFPLTKEPDIYDNNPCYKLYKTCLRDFKLSGCNIDFSELNFRLEEFNCFKDNILDLVSLENLYEFYNIEFDQNKFK